MNLSQRPIDHIRTQLDEIQQLNCDDANANAVPLCRYAALVSLSRDLDAIRKRTYNSSSAAALDAQLHELDRQLHDLMFEVEHKISELYDREQRQQQAEEDARLRAEIDEGTDLMVEDSLVGGGGTSFTTGKNTAESVGELRKRLLATKNQASQLDAVQTVESQNDYHESLQGDLMDALPAMVSGIKDQALQFQDLLKQDAQVLKEASENFEKSHGRFGVVSDMLSKYHKEGRLGFFFYIRVTAMVLVAFLLLVFLIRLIPARY